MKASENAIQLIKDLEKQTKISITKEMIDAEKCVNKLIEIPLYQNQFDALVSFCFGVGTQKFRSSNLVQRLNSRESPNIVAAEEIPKWNKKDGVILQSLSRVRSAELELFCSEPPKVKVGLVEITTKFNTWLKRRLVSTVELSREEKANIYKGRTIKNCRIIDQKDCHTFVDLGIGLGKWWIYDAHWDGLTTKNTIYPYAVEGDLHYLRNFPYIYQKSEDPDRWKFSQADSIAMCLRYLDTPGINDGDDYLKVVNKYGNPLYHRTHLRALAEIGISVKFTKTIDKDDVKKQIDLGLPVVAGILHHGAVSDPSGGGHFVVITGYSGDYWLVQDPCGELDLVKGGWAATGAVAGRNVHYSFKNMNPRFFVGGGGSGWCWYDFKRLK